MPSMHNNETAAVKATPRMSRFWRGIRLGIPIFLGYMPVGMAFGVLAATLGFSVVQAVTCSATALAGAGQFIALSLMRAGEAAFAVIAATTVINLRYVLFAATISPHLKKFLRRIYLMDPRLKDKRSTKTGERLEKTGASS